MKRIIVQYVLSLPAIFYGFRTLSEVPDVAGFSAVNRFAVGVALAVIGLRLAWCADVGMDRYSKRWEV